MVAINGHIKSWHLADTCQWHIAGLLLALTRWQQWSFAENIAPGTITNRKFEPSIADFWRKLSRYHEMFWNVFYVSTNVYFLGGRGGGKTIHSPVTCRYMPDTLWHFRFLAFPREENRNFRENPQKCAGFFLFTHRTTLADLRTLPDIGNDLFFKNPLPSIKLNRLNSILLEKMKMDWGMSDDSTSKWQDAFVTSYLFSIRWVQSRRADALNFSKNK